MCSLCANLYFVAAILVLGPAPTAISQEASNYSRLAEPAVAAAVRLSDEQKSQVAAIITERDAALNSAEAQEQKGIRDAADEKLRVLLNADQTRLFQSLFAGKRLRFNFRAQKWADVLDYIADEAGLSLVMNEPPGGVFNYSDSKEYTPTEAIDLINGWLLTKGYTLIRRDRLLMCLPLRDGLPENAIPRVTVDELPSRGRFELVTVLIPLEGRPVDTAAKELEPLKGTYGQIVPLAATGQIQVTDTAGNIQAMRPILQAIPVPPTPPAPAKPKPKPPAPKPPDPVIEVHPIRHANPDQVGEVLRKFVSGTILVDATANQITISAIPSAQETARGIIKRLEENQGPDKQPRLELYPVRVRNTDALTETIRLATPNAQLRFEDGGRTLVVWASPTEHSRISGVLEDLSARAKTQTGTQLERYTVERVSPSAALALLQELLPDARMTADDATDTLVVVGSLDDHTAVRALIEQIDGDDRISRQLKTYPIVGVESATVSTLAELLAPGATVSFDAAAENALIAARAAEHEAIGPVLEKLRASADAQQAELRVYSTSSEVDDAATLLSQAVPGASVTGDAANSRLVVVASPDEHTAISRVLKQVDELPVQNRELKTYELGDTLESATVTTLLTSLAPRISVTEDPSGRKLFVVGTESDHAIVDRSLKQLSENTTARPELRFHPMDRSTDIPSVTALLTELVPDATIQNDTTNRRLVVLGDEAAQEVVANVLRQASAVPAEQSELKPYPLEDGQSSEAVSTLLGNLVPDANITVDEAAGRLLVVATPTDHAAVERTLTQLRAGDLPELRFYPVDRRLTGDVAAVLSAVVPSARITFDEAGSRLSVVASASQHARLQATLAKLGDAAEADDVAAMRIYAVTPDQRRRFSEISTSLSTQFPGIQFITNADPRELTVWARPEQHEAITQILEQLKLDRPLNERPSLVVYPISKVDVASVQAVLSELFPLAKITADEQSSRLLIQAVPAEHTAIDAAIKQLDSDAPVSTKIKLMAYPVDGLTSATVVGLLSAEVPEATVIEDTAAETLIVRGRIRDHEKVASIIDTLRTTAGTLRQRTVVVYPAVLGTAATAVDFITTAFPGTRAVVDPNSRRLTVWATQTQHEQIASAVSAMSGAAGGELAPTTETYAVRGVDPTTLIEMFSRAVPDAKVVANADGTRLVAWARKTDQDTIRSIISGASSGAGENRELHIFEIAPEHLATARALLASSLPEVTFLDAPTGNALLAWAEQPQADRIHALLEQIRSSAAFSSEKAVRVFDVKSIGIASAREVLTVAFPDVSFLDSPDSQALIAHVTATEGADIERTLKEISANTSLSSERRLEIYDLSAAGGNDARAVLTATVPSVTFSGTGAKLVAWVLPTEHQRIQATLKQLADTKPFRRETSLKAYSIRGLGASAQSVIQAAVPSVAVSVGASPDQLLIRAGSFEHGRVQETIKQLRTVAESQPERLLQTFSIDGLDPDAVRTAVEPLLDSDVQLTIDPTGRRLFVRAFPEKQEQVRTLISGILESLPSRKGVVTRVYRTLIGDADEVEEVATALFPDAVIRADADRKVVVATALPEEHEKIEQIVSQMVADGEESDIAAKTYPLRTADGDVLENTLRNLYPRGDVRVSWDAGAQTLLVVATDAQHQAIKALVDQVESSDTREDNRTVEFYSLEGADGSAVQSVVEDLLNVVDPKASVVNDDTSRQLVVTTIADGHRKVKDAIKRLQSRAEPREVEVFQLSVLEPTAAELAVSSVFDTGLNDFRDQPIVRSEDESQQLIVRGTKAQIEQIRSLLIKMGETALRTNGNAKLRVIPIDGNPEEAIQRIQKLWPRLRPNPIRVLIPGQAVRELRRKAPEETPDDPCGSQAPQEATQTQDDQEPAPILLVPGNGRITISSDDTEALDQLESVLRAVFSGSRRRRSSRDFSVYALSNAAATSVSDLLNNIFGRNNSPIAFGSVVIVPDQRLNALIVFAGRADRERIEQLIEILDSQDTPETLATNRTKVIRVLNADAEQIREVVSGIYRAQMTAGGSRQQVSIPRGVPAEVATVLRQINAAASSPLLNIQVEKTTNSLVVMAPTNLLEEVSSLIDELDKASGVSRARGVSIIELQKTNSRRVMDVLDRVLKR